MTTRYAISPEQGHVFDETAHESVDEAPSIATPAQWEKLAQTVDEVEIVEIGAKVLVNYGLGLSVPGKAMHGVLASLKRAGYRVVKT